MTPHPKSQRVRSGRQPGGQPGHAGHSVRLVAAPDEVRMHAPTHGQGWAKDLKGVLGAIKQAVDDARGHGMTSLPADVRHAFARRYDAALAAGAQANPPPPPTGTRGRPKRGKAGSLVDRLRDRKDATLAFMTDFAIPFDNNQAERDIRMTTVREKISGCFRTTTGAARFCRIRGYLSTLRKQGLPILAALSQAILGTPPMPLTTALDGPG